MYDSATRAMSKKLSMQHGRDQFAKMLPNIGSSEKSPYN